MRTSALRPIFIFLKRQDDCVSLHISITHTKMKKDEYRLKNEQFLADLAQREGINTLKNGVLYEVITSGDGKACALPSNVVTIHYKGSLISGYVFDDSHRRGYPEAFRVSELVDGMQTALLGMHVGDTWRVYIPWSQGYGKRTDGDIPGFSTLIFEIELIGVV